MYVSTTSADRDTLLRAIRFERPDYIPMTFHINAACWDHYDQDWLQGLMAEHPFLFPDFRPAPTPLTVEYDANARAVEPYTDDFGCVWHTAMNGIVGAVTEHPLSDISRFSAYRLPEDRKSVV